MIAPSLLSDASRDHDLRNGVVHPHPEPLIMRKKYSPSPQSSPSEEEETVTLTPTLSPQGRGSLKGRVIYRERRSRKRFSIGCGRVGEGGREESEKSKRSI
jgi:hypothetical protein